MKIEEALENPLDEGTFDRINPFSNYNKQYVVDSPLGRIEVPQWMSRTFHELDATIPLDLTVMAFPIAIITGRVISDMSRLLIRVRRNYVMVEESPEFKEAFQFIRNMKPWTTKINTKQDARRAIADINKATKLINKFVAGISKEDIPAMERSRLMRDVSYLYEELERFSLMTMAKAENKLKEKNT